MAIDPPSTVTNANRGRKNRFRPSLAGRSVHAFAASLSR